MATHKPLPTSAASFITLSVATLVLLLSVACSIKKEEKVSNARQPQVLAEVAEGDTDEEVVVTGSKISRAPAELAKRKSVALKSVHVSDAPYGYAPPVYQENPNENYHHRAENSFKIVDEHPVSTFSIDVDSAAYANARRVLNSGSLPHSHAIRSEEFINYFDYQYPIPSNSGTPFSITTEVAPSPWAKGRHLLHIGLQGYHVDKTELPPANLVFLVDVSGSMNSSNKLGLLKTSLKLLSRSLSKRDRVSIVVYAGASGVVLEPTAGNDKRKIEAALNRLQAGGSTNGAAGIQLAYSIAQQNFQEDGINRVILATDGDFNVGVTNIEALKNLIKQQRDTGIELTTLGFGTGNYNDALMNELAEIGNGNAAYIDTALEARKALVDELSGTLLTIAKDVKIQIEFSPQVAEYRLIGYESRLLKREDFNNDKIDAGEIGAGHSVTALYEIVLKDSSASTVDPLRYNHQGSRHHAATNSDELAYLKLRYKLPNSDISTLVQQAITGQQITPLANSSENFRWSSAVAAFAQQLAGSDWLKDFDYRDTLKLGKGAQGDDANGYRAEMIRLVKMADTLHTSDHSTLSKR